MASSSRLDGRGSVELRPLSASVGELDRADGSGRFGFGPEAALASFSGPIEVRLREELPERATFEVVHRPLEGVGATPSRAIVTTLQAALPPLLGLSQHPRSLCQLIVQTLSPSPTSSLSFSSTRSSAQRTWPPPSNVDEDGDDEGDVSYRKPKGAPMSGTSFASRAAGLNAATLAILDAGSISLRAVPIAVSLAVLPSGLMANGDGGEGGRGLLVVDPDVEEEDRATSRHVFGWAFGAGISTVPVTGSDGLKENQAMEVDNRLPEETAESELIWAESEGSFSRNEFEEAMVLSRLTAETVLDFIRSRIGEHLGTRLRS